MRLDKYLADMGLGSRSDIKKNIRAGKAVVNGSRTKDPGLAVTPDMDIQYLGQNVSYEEFAYYMLHKPAGVISASEDKRQQTVIDLIDEEQKRKDLFPVGRLDKDTEGLLLITNDGQLAHRLLSPKHHVDKVYFARIAGKVTEADVEKFRQGLYIDEELTCLPAELQILSYEEAEQPIASADLPQTASDQSQVIGESMQKPYDPPSALTSLSVSTNLPQISDLGQDTSIDADQAGDNTITEIQITIREGKFHQIKRMFQAVGKEVIYLKRLSMGSLQLDPDLAPGQYRRLTEEELALLLHC